MEKLLFVTNIPAVYRVDFFDSIALDKGFDVSTLYYAKEREELIDHRARYVHTPYFIKGMPIRYRNQLYTKVAMIPNPLALIKTIHKIGPNYLIVSEFSLTAFLVFLHAKVKNIPYIQWSDGTLHSERDISKVKRIVRKILCRFADAGLASSSRTKEMLIAYGLDEDKINVSMLYPVPRERVSSEISLSKDLVAVGFLSFGKGYDLLIDIFSKLNYGNKLYIIGDGTEYETLLNKIIRLGLEDRVILTGRKSLEEIDEIMSQSSLLVTTTRDDCFGLVVSEAINQGLPVVVSKYAGCVDDLVIEGINGYVIDPYATDETARIIDDLLKDGNRIKALSEGAKVIKPKYDREAVLEALYQTIDMVTGRGDKSE